MSLSRSMVSVKCFALGDVAVAQEGAFQVAVLVETEQRVIAGALEVAVVRRACSSHRRKASGRPIRRLRRDAFRCLL